MQNHASPAASRTTLACVACRASKIRCLRLEGQGGDACENCHALGKECRFEPLAKTRRRKRTDVRVSELELQVRSLTAALRQTKNDANDRMATPQSEEAARVHNGEHDGTSTPERRTETANGGGAESVSPLSSTSATSSGAPIPPSAPAAPVASPAPPPTVIVSWPESLQLFRRYQTSLAPTYPIVPVDSSSMARELDVALFRRAFPLLFLAMTTAAASASADTTRDALHDALVRSLADKVLIEGAKSLEILQALLITVAWYRPCGSFNDTKFLQFTQAASLMAQELDLDRPRTGLMLAGDSEVVGLRTLVASFCQSSAKDLLSSKRTLQYDAGSIAAKVAEFEAASSAYDDRHLVAYAKCQMMVQDALRKITSRCRAVEDIDTEDVFVASTLSVYTSQLLRLLLDCGAHNGFLQVAVHSGILRLHEITLYPEYGFLSFRPPYTFDGPHTTPNSIGAEYLTAMRRCQASSHALLDVLCKSDLTALSVMPSAVFVRMMHALLVLYRMHLSASAWNHPLSAVLGADQLRLPDYVAALVQLLEEIDRPHSFRGANKYLAFLRALEGHCAAESQGNGMGGSAQPLVRNSASASETGDMPGRSTAGAEEGEGGLQLSSLDESTAAMLAGLGDAPDWWYVNNETLAPLFS